MPTIVKAALMAALVIALAWPVLFWGKSGSSQDNGRNIQKNLPVAPFIFRRYDEMLW
jgi:hypothetical protein